MSYLVLARKYRPMRFADVVDQRHVTVTLENAIKQDRLANAYLFSGPRGVGKTTVARILAKAINCDKGPTTEPCNQCNSCHEITDSRSLEVFEIDGASNRGIDEVRNLREGLRYAATPGKYKIHIIDEVHMLTTEAFNALLKTLEEPPKNVLFIFATTEPHKVPATILSRCQRFDFKRISSKDIITQLNSLCDNEGIHIDAESLRIIAHKADGSMRDAQSILDQVVSFSGEHVGTTDVASLLGIIDQELFFEITNLIKTGNVDEGIALAGRIFSEGYDFSEVLNGIAEHMRNFLVVKAAGSTDELDASEEYRQRYLDQHGDFEIEDLLRLIKIATAAEQDIRRSVNPRLRLEVALVKMIKLDKSVQLSQLLSQVDVFKKNSLKKPENSRKSTYVAPKTKSPTQNGVRVESSPVVADASGTYNDTSSSGPTGLHPTKPTEEKSPIVLADIENRWNEVVEEVKKRKIALGSFLSEGWPTQLRDNTLEITFGANNGFHISSIERNRETIQNILAEVLGTMVRIRCRKDEEGILEQRRKTPARIDKQQELQKLLDANPMANAIVETFDAVLVK
jgi:DNA polymerase-3 subunit gamma/tau